MAGSDPLADNDITLFLTRTGRKEFLKIKHKVRDMGFCSSITGARTLFLLRLSSVPASHNMDTQQLYSCCSKRPHKYCRTLKLSTGRGGGGARERDRVRERRNELEWFPAKVLELPCSCFIGLSPHGLFSPARSIDFHISALYAFIYFL